MHITLCVHVRINSLPIMKSFIVWLIIDTLCLSELVCAYTNSLLPFNIGLAIIAGILSIILLLYAIARGKKSLLPILGAVPFSVTVAFILFNYQQCQRMDNAHKLIHALEDYKKLHQRYPDTLKQLMPEELANIPENHFGFASRGYVYHRYGNTYDIKVETGTKSGVRWLSSEHAWDTYN
jgi:hypothetical protein